MYTRNKLEALTMITDKFYIRVKDGEHDEMGFIYQGVRGIRVPEGYVAIINLHCTSQTTEVVRADEVAEISEMAYTCIENRIVDGDDPSDDIADAFTEAGVVLEGAESPEAKLREALNEFKRAAHHLTFLWEGADHGVQENVGINNNYPFAESFDELYLKIIDWGLPEVPQTPLEKAISWIEAHDKDADVRHYLELPEKEAIKNVMFNLVVTITEWENDGKEVDEIYELIHNL
jgi:hypothetical protein